MDTDACPADQPVSAPSDTRLSDSVPVNEASGVEVTRRAAALLPGSEVEDLDSYNLIEPPPLDWRSDSSSEHGSADDLDDPGFLPSAEALDEASRSEPVLLPLDVSDTVDQLNVNPQKLVQKDSEPVRKTELEVEEGAGVRVMDSEGGEEQEEERLRDVENILTDRRSGDEDHSRIHTLLSQLQLMGEDPHPSHRAPPHHHFSSLSELEDADNTETAGLLFSESHQRDLLGLLQCTEIGATPRPTCLPHRGEVDAVVSVSYSQEDAQRFWGHYGNGQHQRHRDDSVTSLPDDEYPEPVWMKLGEDPPDEEAAAEQVGEGAVGGTNVKYENKTSC